MGLLDICIASVAICAWLADVLSTPPFWCPENTITKDDTLLLSWFDSIGVME